MTGLPAEREAFFRAIFDAPDDDLPRLAYADWLEEHGEELPAKLIRLSFAIAAAEGDRDEYDRLTREWVALANPDDGRSHLYRDVLKTRGAGRECAFRSDDLRDAEEFRLRALNSAWLFGLERVRVTGRVTDRTPFDTLFSAVALRRVRELDLSGSEEQRVGTVTDASGSVTGETTFDVHIVPTVTLSGVEALAGHRGAHRLTALDLRYNQLGNDAVRVLSRSPHLENLERLEVAEGNNFRGKVYQLLIERFGEEVVS